MNPKKLPLTVLALITVGHAVSASAQIYEQSALPNNTANPDWVCSSTWPAGLSSYKSSASGLSGGPTKDRYIGVTSATTNTTYFTVSPNNGNATGGTLQIGTSYALAVTFPNNTSGGQTESTDMIVTTTDSGTTGLDTFVGTSAAFQKGSGGLNNWVTIGNVTISAANPTFTFTWKSGVNTDRWYGDAVRFTALPPGPTPQFWDTGSVGGSGSWDTTTPNWNSSSSGSGTQTVYNQSDAATFLGTPGTVAITGAGITTDGGLEFLADGFTIAGGPLTLGSSPSTAGTNITGAASSTLTINSVISGIYGLCNAGPGTVALGAVNDFTGTVTLTAGTLQLLPNVSQSFTSLAGTSGALALGANTLTVGSDGTSTIYSGRISDGGSLAPGALVKTGTGTLSLGTANTYVGKTTINQGTISITADGALGAAPSSLTTNQLTLNGNGATLYGAAVMTLNKNRGITLVGSNNLSAAHTTDITLNSPITGPGSLTVSGGWFDFNATNTFAGDLTFITTDNTSVRFNTNNSAGLGTIYVSPQAVQPFTIRNDIANVVSSLTNPLVFNTGGANLNIDTGSGNSVFALGGNISGTATGVAINDNPNGQGTVILSGNNSAFAGGFELEGGTLSLGNPYALGTGAFAIVAASAPNSTYNLQAALSLAGANAVTNAVVLEVANGTVINGTNALELSGPITLLGTGVNIEVDNTAPTILSGNIGDGGAGLGLSVSSAGSGILTLSGSNSYTGGTVVNSGTLDGSGPNSLPGTVTVYGGALQLDNSQALATNGTLNIYGGTVNLNFTGYLTVSSVNGNSGPVTYGANANNLGGAITGTGFINVVPVPAPFSITSQSLDATGTNFVVCFTSVPGQTYDIMTNTTLSGTGAWVSAGNTNATGTTTCFTLPGGIVGNPSVFVQIQAP